MLAALEDLIMRVVYGDQVHTGRRLCLFFFLSLHFRFTNTQFA